jgi:hypothetical protein
MFQELSQSFACLKRIAVNKISKKSENNTKFGDYHKGSRMFPRDNDHGCIFQKKSTHSQTK